MVQTVLLAFVILLLVVGGMAIGAILTGRRLTGSCGGLSAIDGVDRCTVCGRDVGSGPKARDMARCDGPPN